MAEIEEYLSNFLKLEDAEAKTMGIGKGLAKRTNETYKVQDEKFIIQAKSKEMLQYATFYWLRLQSLKAHVKEACEMKWAKDHHLIYVNNILDIKPH